ncbi:hypothetical protein AYX15_04575 [Cryptococcus neoformans]|nr:hypothetical protein AYX15_04575 [Cryptococcus neoformans var. grubii]
MPATKSKTNVALLTEGASYIQRAKKARKEQVEEIKFDDEARREWLTGFSKRKKAKAEEKKARAKERERQEHLEERRNARKELKQRAAENVKSVRRAMGLEDLEDDDEEEGSEEEAWSPVTKGQEEAEFSDDQQIATVTITEDFDPSASIYPIQTSTSPSPSVNDKSEPKPKKSAVKLLPPSSRRAQKADEKKKEKKKVSRSMETKAERRKGKEMELRKRSKKAALAMERKGKTPRGLKKGMGKGRR